MMKGTIATLVATAAICGLAMPAMASVVYSQPGTTACSPSCWTSSLDASNAGFASADNFTLGSGATVGSASWQGIYIGGGSTPSAPTTLSWLIGLFDDNSGAPGTLLGFETPSAANVTTTLIGSGFFASEPVNLYSFSYVFTTPVALAAGTYWFAPISQAVNFSPFFSWSPATTDVDNFTYQSDSNLNVYQRPNDRAFTLYSAAVPEPASWALMIGGFALAGATLRRRSVRLITA